jgi:hypothetical protein
MMPTGTMIVAEPLDRRSNPPSEEWQLSDGEVHFMWCFIQGSIMIPETRWALRRAWGLCARHAWGAILGEAAYRHGYLHGPVQLYEDLMERAVAAFQLRGPWDARRVARRLRDRGPCLWCSIGYTRDSRGTAREDLIRTGRDPRALREFAGHTRPYWRPTVCGRCVARSSSSRCRRHFREDVSAGIITDVGPHRALIENVLAHLAVYSRSFVWEHHGIESDEDRAALFSAVGWCSGWRGLLAVLE